MTGWRNYAEAGYDPDDSLDGGQWMWDDRRAIRVWVRTEPVVTDLSKLIACPTCHAKVDQTCRTKTGHSTTPHRSRLAPRLCPCGAIPPGSKTYCDPCGIEAYKKAKRDWSRRQRAREQEAA